MKKYIKGLFTLGVIFALTASGVYAETTDTANTGKTEYNYSAKKLGITDKEPLNPSAPDESQELTILVVKGDFTGTNAGDITSDNVYYVDQESGTSFSCFQNLGLKQTGLEAGTYTLIAGGANVTEPMKELMIIGNVDGSVPKGLEGKTLNFGTVSNVTKVQKDGEYVYACLCTVPKGSEPSKLGFIFQRNDKGQWQHLYKTLDLSKKIETSIDAPIEFGLQVNGITEDPDTIQFSAIPYAEKVTVPAPAAE
ncbi:MAG: hypothetical protein J6N52_12860 [Clostridia bacterium]|nr:hypothetical protein [Clostridia bacterium]